MTDRLNPSGQTAAESDYRKKFNRDPKQAASKEAQDLKQKEASGDASWKTTTKNKSKSEPAKKNRFGFSGRRAGKLSKGSAILFLFGVVIAGVWYTSVFAPNILLVNIKEMYTNDLADATTALEVYTQVSYFNKIGPMSGQDCVDGQPMSSQPIKCKLTTMSRTQKEAFERQGFMFGFGDINLGGAKVNGDVAAKKVYEDNRDDGDPSNDKEESRYKVLAILPPNYKAVVDSLKTTGVSSLMQIAQGNKNAAGVVEKGVSDAMGSLLNPLKDASQSPDKMLSGILEMAPITSGPQLWLYSQLSPTTRTQVYSVFNPKSSFFNDAKFKERIKTRYNMTKEVTVTGKTEEKVNQTFDKSVQKADGGIDALTGQTNPTNGTSLASLSGPLNPTQLQSLANSFQGGMSNESINNTVSQLPFAVDLQTVGNLLATNTYSYTDLMCSWYTIGKISSNAIIRAKASTAARYALQYLKAADSIKSGSAQEVPTNVLASKLAESTMGGYEGGSATDSLSYRFITYGDLLPNSPTDLASLMSDPSKITNIVSDGVAIVAYNLSAYESIGTLAPSWAQIIPNATALGAVVGASGALLPPPANAPGMERQYCMSGETQENKTQTKGQDTNSTRCTAAVAAMSPAGMQAATAGAAEVARRTCPPVNASDDNLIQLYIGNWRGPVSNTMLPSQKIVQASMTPYIAGWFGANTMVTAAATQQLYTSRIKGIAANYALFSGMGELLGDMAMSRGLMPSSEFDMMPYLGLGEVIGVQNNMDEIARHNGKQNPFDPYNKFSFIGSIVRSLPMNTSSNQAPILATLSGVLSVVNNTFAQAGKSSTANAFYHQQPMLLGNEVETTAERTAGYLARLSGAFCPVDLELTYILIQPDIMCNVRYSMPLDDIPIALNTSGVIDYMTQSHSNVYDSKSQELEQRVGKGDLEGNKAYLQLQKQQVDDVKSKPFIDKNTGKPTPGGEYEKYLQYCVNRLDPWGRSGLYMRYDELSAEEKAKRGENRDGNGVAIDPSGNGDPNQRYGSGIPTMAANATQSDLDWYTGKKCTRSTDQAEMLKYFRVYTTLCSVDGSMAGIIDCTEPDRLSDYSDPFYLNNDILYTSWY